MRANLLLAMTALATMTVPAAATAQTAAAVTVRTDGAEARQGDAIVRVVALTDAILRIRIGRDGAMPEDASWAVDKATRAQKVAVTPAADGFTTRTMRVRFLADGRLRVEDLAGNVISEDATPATFDGTAFTLKKTMPQAEHYFGMGDKTGGLDRRGKTFVHWNTDAFGFTSAEDPIYKSIPFFIGVGGAGGSYGVFLDNTWRSWFDFGHRNANELSFGGPDGPVDYYLIAGPTTAEVVRRYTDLTGKAPLTPQWALGYQQSRYSYMTADELRGVAARLRQERVPTDVLWLDIDWQDRNRPFTVDTKAFPDMKGMIGDLKQQGFKVVTITDMHIARAEGQGYAPYDDGTKRDEFIRRADHSVYVAPVWPGPSVFPDFTQAKTRDWFGGLFADQVKMGVAGAWNDMNEPAIFETPTKTMPDDVVHRIVSDDFARRTATHAEIHNVYGMENTRATFEGLRKLSPNERPFVMTRASYAGGQRYSVTWTGDNLATWDHLKLSIQQIINLGLSGFSYGAADVSGFAGGPGEDLLTRWFQIGAFYPVFRNHSAKGTPRVEPWVGSPEHLAIRRRFVEERYRLMPYLYALAEQNARTGDPILRPVFYDYPSAMRMSCDQSWTFTLGRSLLVAPAPNPDQPRAYDVCLPAGGWYDYWTGQRAGVPQQQTGPGQIQSATQATGQATVSGDRVTVTPTIATLPVFVRAGTILPRQPLVQSTAQVPDGPLQLDVYPGEDCRGDLYADDGHSMGYTRGQFLRQAISCQVGDAGMTLRFAARQGRYAPWWKQLRVVVHGWTGEGAVSAARRAVAAQRDATANTLSFTLPDQRTAADITIARR